MTFGIKNDGFGNFIMKNGRVGSWIETANGQCDVYDDKGNYLGTSFNNDYGSTFYAEDGSLVVDTFEQNDGASLIFGSDGSSGYMDGDIIDISDPF